MNYLQGASADAEGGVAKPPKLSKRDLKKEAAVEIPFVLFAITCAGNEFSAEPAEVGVYVFGNPKKIFK